MLRSFDGSQSSDDDRVRIRTRGCDAARGERGDVELVVGADDERGANQLRGGGIFRRPVPLQRPVDRLFDVGRFRGNTGQQVDDAPAGLRDGTRTEIEREWIARGDERQHRLRARDERQTFNASSTGDDVDRRPENVGVDVAGPDQRCDVFNRRVARELGCVGAAIVETAISDERDARFEDRHPPMQRPPGRFRRIFPLFRAAAQAIDVFTRVALFAAASRRRRRAHESSTDIRVQRLAAHTEQLHRLRCRNPCGIVRHRNEQ